MRFASSIGLFCVGLFLNGPADAQSPAVVRVGILNDQSGPYADFGGKTSVDAARMAVEDVGGKVLGKPIEIIVGDHQNKPGVASAIARTLGLRTANGLVFTTAFYWDRDEASRAWSK